MHISGEVLIMLVYIGRYMHTSGMKSIHNGLLLHSLYRVMTRMKVMVFVLITYALGEYQMSVSVDDRA